MLTTDDIIAQGYWRRHYHEVRQDYIRAHAHSLDSINAQVRYAHTDGVRERLLAHNARIETEAVEFARLVIEPAVDALNRLGLSREEVIRLYQLGRS